MRIRRIGLLTAGLCLLSTGCGIVVNTWRNVVVQPASLVNECLEVKRSHVWACTAWRHVEKHAPEGGYSHDYRRGFMRGYVDYLERGGKGDPPVVPPVCYRTLHCETPGGHAAAEDWFTGFRHGTALAQASGLRHWITVPASTGYPATRYGRPPAPRPAKELPPELLPMPAEELPPPRVLPDDPDNPGEGQGPAAHPLDGFSEPARSRE